MWVQDFFLIQYFFNFLCGIQGDLENTFSHLRARNSISRFVGPLVGWSETDCSEHATYGNWPCSTLFDEYQSPIIMLTIVIIDM